MPAIGTTGKNWDGGTLYWHGDGKGWSSSPVSAPSPPPPPPPPPPPSSSYSINMPTSSSGNMMSNNPADVRQAIASGNTGGMLSNDPGSVRQAIANQGVTAAASASGSAPPAGGVGSTGPAASAAPRALPAPVPPPPPAAVPIAAPTIRNPYADLANPYTGAYRDALISQRRGAMMQEFGAAKENIRSSFAERGLSQGGTSGMEKQALIEAEMRQANGLGQLNAQASQQTTDAATQFELAKAAGDLQGMSFLEQTYGNRQLLPRQLTQLDIANQRGEIMMPLEAEGYRLDNQGKATQNRYGEATFETRVQAAAAELNQATIGNEAARIELDTLRQTQPGKVEALLASARAAKAQGALDQWEAEHAHELAGWKFAGNLILTLAGSATKLMGYGQGTQAASTPSNTITMPATAGHGA